MNKTNLIIQREYLTRVRKKSFIIMTFLGPVFIAGLMSLGIYLGMSDSSVYNVLVVDNTPQISADSLSQPKSLFWKEFKETPQMKFQYTHDALTNAEFDSSAYSLMLVMREDIVTFPEAELVFRKLPSVKARSYIKSQVEKVIENEKLKLNAIDKRVYDSIRTDVEILSVDSEDGGTSYKQEQAMVGFGFAVLIYFFIFLYGVQVMRGVMEEKSSRIVEVIISSVKPFQLMMGKIIGIALVGLTQFLLWVILTGIIFTVVSGLILPDAATMAEQVQATQVAAEQATSDPMNQAVISDMAELFLFRINWPLMLGMFLFYFLGGYLLYASLFAAVGAAVDNETDTQQFMMPITIPLIFGFIVAQFALTNPEGGAVFWFSQIPFTSPIVMMVRVAMGFDAGTVWQLALSMALLVAGFIGAVWMAGKIYRVGILMYGKKITYKELWKWMRFNS
ncbi:ABC transporter permease [Cryomorpha ignava]|uniref:ABC transporter permease n=1 Tax=Cryomorpha ignava TaxID=101383 RepID=A0A7K3WLR5_9FLAO|nr:ABC transporter permease [Cryomorpha ignava]NEN22448.1 ABC transporter permease [Cryomorpha ignava]